MKKIAALLMTGALAAALILPAAALNYPVDVQYPSEVGGPVKKVYVVVSEAEIEELPKESFVLGGITYDYTDTVCQSVSSVLTKPYTQTETAESDTKDTEKLKAQLEPTKQVTTEDGYTGVLTLKEDSITATATEWGYGSDTKTLQRTYPNLSDADASFVPKEVTSNGRTYILADVSWAEGTAYNPYDEEIGIRYTANATYSSTKKTSWAKKYEINAEYTGDLTKTTGEGYQCTLLFYPQSSAQSNSKTTGLTTPAVRVETRLPIWAYIVGVILLAAAIGGCTYTFIDWKKKHSVK